MRQKLHRTNQIKAPIYVEASDCNWTRTQNYKRTKWSNGWVFVYKLSGSGFESSCSHLDFRFCACFEEGVPWHSGNYRVCIHFETRTWHDKNIQSILGSSFSNGNYLKFPIQFWRERLQHLQKQFFLKSRPTHCHINSTSVITLVEQNKLSFSRIEVNNPLFPPV